MTIHYQYSHPHQSENLKTKLSKKFNQTWEDEGVGLPPNNDLTQKKSLSMNWWEPYVSFEINPNLKTTFPWRTPWRTSPSISPPFFRPIRTFDSNSPRIPSHNSLQLNCQVLPNCFNIVMYTPDLQAVHFWRCQWWSCHNVQRDDYTDFHKSLK